MNNLRVVTLVGTRPDAIKMAPVIKALRARPEITTKVLLSGQHRELCWNALASFGIEPDRILTPELPDFSLASQSTTYLRELSAEFTNEHADLVLVHGDTTTAFVGALAAFYCKIPVGHVEAGLRSHDLGNPYPEEANRRLIAPLSELLFAPTKMARDNLVHEGCEKNRVLVTGNTVVDAVLELVRSLPPTTDIPQLSKLPIGEKKLILVTAHRRENWGEPMVEICRAILELASQRTDIAIVFPVHPNPRVRDTVLPLLQGKEGVVLIDPLDYHELLALIRQAYLVLTDSGGIQEEAPSMATPVLVLRETTERPEAVTAGTARLVGTDAGRIVRETLGLLNNAKIYAEMVSRGNPFGDGHAGSRIAEAIINWRKGAVDLLPPGGSFVYELHSEGGGLKAA